MLSKMRLGIMREKSGARSGGRNISQQDWLIEDKRVVAIWASKAAVAVVFFFFKYLQLLVAISGAVDAPCVLQGHQHLSHHVL